MTRWTLVVLAVVLAVAPTRAQDDAASVRVFQIHNGRVLLDGRELANAVPDGVDLTGVTTWPLQFSPPVAPVVTIDDRAYVLEGERLVPLEASSRAGDGIYILGESVPNPVDMAEMPRERVRPIVEAAYLRDVADRNAPLLGQMQREMELEAEVLAVAARVRSLPPGDERDGLRADLRARLSDLLALKHDIRAAEIDLAEDRLDAARRRLDRRRTSHDEIVDGRLRDLVGQ